MAQRKPDARAAEPRETILYDLQQGRLPLKEAAPASQAPASSPAREEAPAAAASRARQASADVRHDDRRETYYDQLAGSMAPRKAQRAVGGGERATGGGGAAFASMDARARERAGSSPADVQQARGGGRPSELRETILGKLTGTVDSQRSKFEAGPADVAAQQRSVGRLEQGWEPNSDYELRQRDVGQLGQRGRSSSALEGTAHSSAARGAAWTKEKAPSASTADVRHDDLRETYYPQLAGGAKPRADGGQGHSGGRGGGGDRERQQAQAGTFVKQPQPSRVDARHDDKRETYYDQLAGTHDPRRAQWEAGRGGSSAPSAGAPFGKLSRGWNPNTDFESTQRDVGRLDISERPRDDDRNPRGGTGGQSKRSGEFVKEPQPRSADARYGGPRETYYDQLAGTLPGRVAALRDRGHEESADRPEVGRLDGKWDPQSDYENQKRDVGRLPPRAGLGDGYAKGGGHAPFAGAGSGASTRGNAPTRADVRHDDPRDTFYPQLGGGLDRSRFEQPSDADGGSPRQVGKLSRPWDPKDDWESQQRDVGRLPAASDTQASPSSSSGREPGRGGQGPGADGGESSVLVRDGAPSRADARHDDPRDTYYPHIGTAVRPLQSQFAQPNESVTAPRQVGKLSRPWQPKDDWESQQRDVGRLPDGQPVSSRSGELPSSHAGRGQAHAPASTESNGLVKPVAQLMPEAVTSTPIASVSPREVGALNLPWDPKEDGACSQLDVGKLPPADSLNESQASHPAKQVGTLKPWAPQGSTASRDEPRRVGRLQAPEPGSSVSLSPASPRQVGKLCSPWNPSDSHVPTQREVGKLPPAEEARAMPVSAPLSSQAASVKPWDASNSGEDEPKRMGKLAGIVSTPGKVAIPEAIAARSGQPLQPGTAYPLHGVAAQHPAEPQRSLATSPASYASAESLSPRRGHSGQAPPVPSRKGSSAYTSTKTSGGDNPPAGVLHTATVTRGTPGAVKPGSRGGAPRGSGVGMSDFGRSGRPKETATGGRGASADNAQATVVHRPQQVAANRSAPVTGRPGGGGSSPSAAGGHFMPLTAVGGGGGGGKLDPGWDYGKVRIGAKKMEVTDNLYTGVVTEFYDPTGVKDHCPKCGAKRAGRDRFCPTDGALYNV